MAEITHRTIETNGINMHLAEAGEGPLLVLCHGFPESWYSWRHQLPVLADAGYHVVAPDQRGYGGTDAPPAVEDYTMFHLVGDIVGLVAALGEMHAVIIGHDWGAPVAWTAALWRPDVFHAVAALSVPLRDRGAVRPTELMKQMFGDRFFYVLYFQAPGVAEHELQHDVRRTVRRLLIGASADSPDRGLDLLKDAPPRSGYFLDQLGDLDQLPAWLTEQDLDFFTAEFERTGFRGGLNWYRNQDRNWELSAPFQGRKVEQPALFVSGDRDLVRMTPEFETEMRKVVPNLAEVVTLPDVGHWTQQESPEQTNTALLRFLDGLDWPERR